MATAANTDTFFFIRPAEILTNVTFLRKNVKNLVIRPLLRTFAG
jgi:hypothetical protein